MDTNTNKPVAEKKEINLIDFILYLTGKWKLYLKWGILAAIAGLIIAFSLPKEYTTTVMLAPETADNSTKMGSLGGLAAMAGIDLNNVAGPDALSPTLYPNVVGSTPFLLELFSEELTNSEKTETFTLYDYMESHQRKAWWTSIVQAPLKFIDGISSLISDKSRDSTNVNPFHLTRKQETVLNELRKRIIVGVDKKTQVITVSVQMQDPLISAILTRDLVEKLQTYITNYRTQKAKKDLEFTDKVLTEAREAYYKAQKAYAAHEDANKNIISASNRTEQERLRNEMTLTFNVYNSLAQKQEQDKLRVQEQTPVYTIIEPATVPLKASSPRKLIILVGMIFVSVLGITGYLVIRKYAPLPTDMNAQ